MALRLKVVTPERTVLEETVDSLTAMTEAGEVTILPGHVALTANLRAGEAKVKRGGKDEYLAFSTGFLQVRGNDEVVVLADTAERMEELEMAQIEAAKERAQKHLEEARMLDDVTYANAAALMERELARYKVATRRHSHRGQHVQETQP